MIRISINSFGYGIGKSTLIANLATVMAQLGSRVGIIDSDPLNSLPSLFEFSLDQAPHQLSSYLAGTASLEDILIDISRQLRIGDTQIRLLNGAIFLIAASSQPGDLVRLTDSTDPRNLESLMQDLARKLKLDLVLFDTQAGINQDNLLLLTLSDMMVMLTGIAPQELQGTAVYIDVAQRLVDNLDIQLLVNQVAPDFNLGDIRRKMLQTYHVPVLEILPYTQELKQHSGVFCLHYPDHPITHMIRAVGSQLAQKP